MAEHHAFSSVSGNVVGIDNRPLEHVRVELHSRNGSIISSLYTDSAGTFEFHDLDSGNYDVMAVSGVDLAEQRIDLNNMPISIVLRMAASGSPNDRNGKSSVSVAQYLVPEKAQAALEKAREASAKGKNDEAERHVAQALEIYPRYADALTLRAILKMNGNDIESALADVQEAITNDKNCGLAYSVMGALLNMQSKFDDAARALERAQSLSPDSWQGYFEMGKAMLGKAQYETALQQFDRAQTLVAHDYPLLGLAKAHAMLGLNRYSDAVTELQAYLAKEPNGPMSQDAQRLLAQAQASLARGDK
jgi:tetratricopeptide (TPR) repeat protein